MIIVHIIRNGDPRVSTFKYKKSQYYLEQTLRGAYGDLVLVHGLEIQDVTEKLMTTLKYIVKRRKGLIIFMDDGMQRLMQR